MPEIGSGDDKELIFFAILFRLNILCDVIHDVIDKHVYVWQIWLMGQSDSFGNDWLQLLQRKVDILKNILFNVLSTVDMLQKFSLCVCGMHLVGIEMKWSAFYAPPCIYVTPDVIWCCPICCGKWRCWWEFWSNEITYLKCKNYVQTCKLLSMAAFVE